MPVHEFLENFMPAAETPRPFHSRAEWKALWSAVPIGRKPEWKMYQSIVSVDLHVLRRILKADTVVFSL